MGKNGILKNKAGEQIFPATTADQVSWNDRMNLKQAISEKLGAPYAASTVSSMTDRTRIYVYTGDESGYTKGNWYYWNGSSWVSGGVYNSVAVETDKTLTVAGKAADGEVVGQEIGSLKESLDTLQDRDIVLYSDLANLVIKEKSYLKWYDATTFLPVYTTTQQDGYYCLEFDIPDNELSIYIPELKTNDTKQLYVAYTESQKAFNITTDVSKNGLVINTKGLIDGGYKRLSICLNNGNYLKYNDSESPSNFLKNIRKNSEDIEELRKNSLLNLEFVKPPIFYSVAGLKNLMYYFQNIMYKKIDSYTFTHNLIGWFNGNGLIFDGITNETNDAIDYAIKDCDSASSKICEINIPFKACQENSKNGTNIGGIMMLGDSTVYHGYIMAELANRFEKDNIQFAEIGNVTKTVADSDGNVRNVKIEGRAGWSTYDYLHTKSYNNMSVNSFLNNNTFDFSYYCKNNNVSKGDLKYLLIQMGINDSFRPMNGTSTVDNLKTIIASVHAFDSGIKIGIGLVIPPYLGKNYSIACINDHIFRLNQNKEIANKINDDNTYIVPINCVLDVKNGFKTEERTIGGRITDKKDIYPVDVTHPSDNGYYQISDEWYAFIKCN